MSSRHTRWFVCFAMCLGGCGAPHAANAKLTVAAAANLIGVFSEIGRSFKAKTGVDVVFSYGSTAQLATQIENGAPFDVFAAADTEHVDSLIASGKLTRDSRAIYALGQLALWIPEGGTGVQEIQDLASPRIRFIAIAQPELAPYGQASLAVLKNTRIWENVRPKLVYGTSISLAKELAASGSANAAFTAYSLVRGEKGTVLKIDPRLYKPIEQAMGIVAASAHPKEAQQFWSFLLGSEGRVILTNHGYLQP